MTTQEDSRQPNNKVFFFCPGHTTLGLFLHFRAVPCGSHTKNNAEAAFVDRANVLVVGHAAAIAAVQQFSLSPHIIQEKATFLSGRAVQVLLCRVYSQRTPLTKGVAKDSVL